ncbi:MAG: preprotein translocase subunit SecG, partial [Bacteriovoracaceae bacterium]
MVSTLMVFQAVIAVILILLVLVQFGKGAEAGLLSAGDSVMSGSQRGNILSKFTVVISVLFFANSIYLAKIQGEKSEKSLLDTEAPVATPFNSDEAKAPEASNPEAAPA